MTRFLAIIRRIFLGGTISFIICLVLLKVRFNNMLKLALTHNNLSGYFSIFFLMSPIMFFIFTVISSSYVRHHGQFAAFHQTQSPVTSFFRCCWHDVISPFKNISNFFKALFYKNVVGRGIFICRFIEMVLLVFICLIGIYSLVGLESLLIK